MKEIKVDYYGDFKGVFKRKLIKQLFKVVYINVTKLKPKIMPCFFIFEIYFKVFKSSKLNFQGLYFIISCLIISTWGNILELWLHYISSFSFSPLTKTQQIWKTKLCFRSGNGVLDIGKEYVPHVSEWTVPIEHWRIIGSQYNLLVSYSSLGNPFPWWYSTNDDIERQSHWPTVYHW